VSRYFTRPRAATKSEYWSSDDCACPSSLDVPDHEAIDTGLLDQHGDSIMVAPRPIGFMRDEEW
jgi:hypothetical protein